MKKFCTNCGAPLDEEAKYCLKCGAKVEVDQQQATQQLSKAETPLVSSLMENKSEQSGATKIAQSFSSPKRKALGAPKWSTAKLIIGIVTIVLFFLILLQSCAVGVGNALNESEDMGGSAGLLLGIFSLIGGIVGILMRNKSQGSIVAGAFYVFAALIGTYNSDVYTDLAIYSMLYLAFGIVFIYSGWKQRQGERGYIS
jgi:uncharacterized membrane protein (UPF0136 family)